MSFHLILTVFVVSCSLSHHKLACVRDVCKNYCCSYIYTFIICTFLAFPSPSCVVSSFFFFITQSLIAGCVYYVCLQMCHMSSSRHAYYFTRNRHCNDGLRDTAKADNNGVCRKMRWRGRCETMIQTPCYGECVWQHLWGKWACMYSYVCRWVCMYVMSGGKPWWPTSYHLLGNSIFEITPERNMNSSTSVAG